MNAQWQRDDWPNLGPRGLLLCIALVGGWCLFPLDFLLAPEPWKGARLSWGMPTIDGVRAKIVVLASAGGLSCISGPELRIASRQAVITVLEV